MNRCPNHQCRSKCEPNQGFCYHCGIAIKVCSACQHGKKLTLNRADGFYCRRCGSVLPAPKRSQETIALFSLNRNKFLSSVRLPLNERSDSFPLISSQANLWVLTSNNNLKIISNHSRELVSYQPNTGRLNAEDLQMTIKYLEPITAPVIFRDRLILFGLRKILSFSIHPNENRWLQNRQEVALPENWRPIFNSEVTCRINHIETPILHTDTGKSTLLRLSYDAILGKSPINTQPISSTTDLLPIAALDSGGYYYWAKDLQTGLGKILYLSRQENNLSLKAINFSAFFFFVRPVMVGERLYAVTEDFRLVELVLQQGEVTRQRKLNQVDRGAHALVVTQERIIVAVHQSLFFFDYQTGELMAIAQDIDPSHLFVDIKGDILAIHRTGKLLMINSAQPLERWGNEDASLDDSRIFDAFITGNSLYTLSENGEVCRFDFN